MATPTIKAHGIEQFIKDNFGIDRVATIKEDRCTFCKGPATEFKNDLSRKEYSISGLCQVCQDNIWK